MIYDVFKNVFLWRIFCIHHQISSFGLYFYSPNTFFLTNLTTQQIQCAEFGISQKYHQFSGLNWLAPKNDHQFSVLNWRAQKDHHEFSVPELVGPKKRPPIQSELVGPKKPPRIQCTELVGPKKDHQFSALNWRAQKNHHEFSVLNWWAQKKTTNSVY